LSSLARTRPPATAPLWTVGAFKVRMGAPFRFGVGHVFVGGAAVVSPQAVIDPTPQPPTPAGAAADSPQPGVALCVSGGGYRAMLFHLGAFWRLNEAGLLAKLDCVSSVSGGSITAAALAARWGDLAFDGSIAREFQSIVVDPVRELARHTIDVGSVVGGILNPFGTVADRVAAAYRARIFGGKTLRDLPDAPQFVINATNVQSGALWRFTKAFMGDYRVGRVHDPSVEMAVAVGASSAFPPFLSPVHLKLDASAVQPDPGSDLSRPPFTTEAVLSDGGVYDNLGLEPAFKRFQTVLVSDAGAKLAPEEDPAGDWARHSHRVIDIVDDQVRSLRKRALIAAYLAGSRQGAYWGIVTDITNYPIPDPLLCPHATTLQLAAVPTRLAAMDDALQERLINWGYAVCDAALRGHYDHALPRGAFPYPRGV
jgi:NTE family protein